MRIVSKLLTACAMSSLLVSTVFVSSAANAGVSGNIGVVSKYVLRGITNDTENDGTAVQGGLDYSHEGGFYAGYWGSNLDYANATGKGFESDFYAGFAGEFKGFSYDIGLIYYLYEAIVDADAPELAVKVGYAGFTAGMKYLLDDVVWGNTGDIYWTLGYSTDIPMGFTLGATLGYYTYENSGQYIASTPEDSAFRHLDISLSHPIGSTGATMSLTGVVGGDDRNGVEQRKSAVIGVSYGFDL